MTNEMLVILLRLWSVERELRMAGIDAMVICAHCDDVLDLLVDVDSVRGFYQCDCAQEIVEETLHMSARVRLRKDVPNSNMDFVTVF